MVRLKITSSVQRIFWVQYNIKEMLITSRDKILSPVFTLRINEGQKVE